MKTNLFFSTETKDMEIRINLPFLSESILQTITREK